MKREDFNNAMVQNVYDVPDLLIEQCAKIEKDARLVISTPEIFDLTRILITGCGDSYAAALAMKPALEYLTGIPTEVILTVDLARYTPAELLARKHGTTLVLAVSNSGAVARVAEAIKRAGNYGCLTVAVTGNKESKLAKAAKKVVPLSIPRFVSGNGVRSYLVSMLSLLIIAIRLGEVRGRYTMETTQHYLDAICAYSMAFKKSLNELDMQMFEIAKRNASKELFDFIGSGGNYGTAWFSQAKMIEATGEWATYADTESWLHLNCFLKHLSRKFTIIYASSKGPELSRSLEVISAISEMKEELYVITDGKSLKVPSQVAVIVIPECEQQWLWPLLNYLPVSLLAGYLCELKGEAYGRGGRDNWQACGTTKWLTDSEIHIL